MDRSIPIGRLRITISRIEIVPHSVAGLLELSCMPVEAAFGPKQLYIHGLMTDRALVCGSDLAEVLMASNCFTIDRICMVSPACFRSPGTA
jgi:hypothetical protein